MSETIIEKLLKGADVEWIQLGERLKRTTGTSITAGKMRELHKSYGPLKIFGGGKTYALVNFNDIPEKDINKYPSIIVKSRGFIEFDYYNEPFSHKNELWSYHSEDKDICIKYIYYYMKTKEAYFQHLGNKMQMPQISIQDTDKFPVPLPPLSVQKEIVRILDAFTAHTAELTAELNERKKQYNYYRDKLLTFSDDEVEWKKLGDITQTTKNIKWKNNNQHYLYIDLTSVDRENNVVARTVEISATNAPSRAQKIVEKNDVIFATTRPTLQRYTIIDEKNSGQIASSGYCVLRAKYKNVLPKWIYYNIASNKFLTYVEANQSGSAYPSISDVKVKEFILPIPSIKTQERIVSILDKFDALTTSISEGLPKEIELRNKQYEYYRDQLLNFSKPDLEN